MDIFFKVLPLKYTPFTESECYLIFESLFQEFAYINSWKTDLDLVISNAFSSKPTFNKHSPSSLLFFGSQFAKLLNLSFNVCQSPRKSTIEELTIESIIDHKLEKLNPSFLSKVLLLPNYLNQEQLKDPYLFLNSFFYHKTLKKWVKYWNILLEFSISKTSLKEYEKFDERECKWLFGLIEATYLIYVRDFQQKEKSHEDNQD